MCKGCKHDAVLSYHTVEHLLRCRWVLGVAVRVWRCPGPPPSGDGTAVSASAPRVLIRNSVSSQIVDCLVFLVAYSWLCFNKLCFLEI